jgi:hypothetical protein
MTDDYEAPHRDPVRDWRLSECIRIVGFDLAPEFAASKIDLHSLERMARSGATPEQLKEWLL